MRPKKGSREGEGGEKTNTDYIMSIISASHKIPVLFIIRDV